MNSIRGGFTVVELIVVITVIAVLAGVTIFSYGQWQRRVAASSVQSDLQNAKSALENYQNFANDYPPNLGGVGYAASPDVALKLFTNAEQVRTYENLSPAENAQLFLNTCNALMPITSGSTTFNTSCSFAGINIHVPGTGGSNIVWKGPELTLSDIELKCGVPCDAAVSAMIAEFSGQGGNFPIDVPSDNVPLPAYTVYSGGPATRYCLEAVSVRYGEITFHALNGQAGMSVGPCPEDPELHYP